MNFTGANLSGADLSGAQLSGADLTGADLTDVKLTDARFSSNTKWPEGFDPANRGMYGPNLDYSGQDLSGKSFIYVGSLKVDIVKTENLKSPMTSLVKK